MCYCTYTVIDIPGFYMVLYLLFQGFSLPWIKPVNSTEVPHPCLIRPGSGWVVTQCNCLYFWCKCSPAQASVSRHKRTQTSTEFNQGELSRPTLANAGILANHERQPRSTPGTNFSVSIISLGLSLEMATMTQQTLENLDDALIKQVQNFLCLYIYARADYKDQTKKDNAWKAIVETLGRNGKPNKEH